MAFPRSQTQARATELPGAQDPSRFIRYRPAQYRRAGFPFQSFSPVQPYAWVPAMRCEDGQAAWIPADLVYARAALVAAGPQATAPLTYATTSGCAAASTAQEAIERALFELVERDAFMRHWLTQQAGAPLSEASLPADIQARLRRLRSLPCEAGIQLLPSR
ncbi:YcaO-like family protein [Achromobacter insuavis]